jgi:hypothetical protein
MEASLAEYEKIKQLYSQYNASQFNPVQTTYGVEWLIPALDENMWQGNGIEYQTEDMARYVKSSMNNEHMKVRIIKYTKTVKREFLDV